jgi:hypothetical protein
VLVRAECDGFVPRAGGDVGQGQERVEEDVEGVGRDSLAGFEATVMPEGRRLASPPPTTAPPTLHGGKRWKLHPPRRWGMDRDEGAGELSGD